MNVSSGTSNEIDEDKPFQIYFHVMESCTDGWKRC